MVEPRICLFHMGYPKCASTLLQNHVFPSLDLLQKINPTGPQFEGIGRPAVKDRLLSQAFARSPEIWQEHWLQEHIFSGSEGSLIVSEEALWIGGASTSQLTAHTNALRNLAFSRGFDKFKVLLIIRRQDERIASAYSQLSDGFPTASQKDFNDFVGATCDPLRQRYVYGARFDYGSQAKQFCDLLGKENVLFLPVEILGRNPVQFLERVFIFFELADAKAKAAGIGGSLGKENVKKVGEHSWKIRSLSPSLRKPISRYFPADKFLREKAFRINDEERRKIQTAYLRSNQLIEELFGEDMGDFGYYEHVRS